MATATPPNKHPGRPRIVDTSATGNTRIRNDRAATASAIRPLEEGILFLAAKQRIPAGGMCIPVTVPAGSTAEFRFRPARCPYSSDLRITVLYSTEDTASTAGSIATETTDDGGTTKTIIPTDGLTDPALALSMVWFLEGGSGDNADLGYTDAMVEVSPTTGDCKIWSIVLEWEPMTGSITVS